MLGKTVNFAWKKLSGTRKLVSDALQGVHI